MNDTAREIQVEFDQLAFQANINGMGQAYTDRLAKLATRVRNLLSPPEAAFYEIRPEDVNQATIKAFGRTWMVANFMGRVLRRDVGKRVTKVWNEAHDHELLQIESDEQFHGRLIHDDSTYELAGRENGHRHTFQSQTLQHHHEGGAVPHGYFEHPEDGK